MTALKCFEMEPVSKLHSAENRHFRSAMKALKSNPVSKPSKNRRKPCFEALKALKPPTGVKGAFQSAPIPCRGDAPTTSRRG